MSSFVIDKKEFVKMAGFVSAFQEDNNFYGCRSGICLTITDENGWRKMDGQDIFKMFVNFFNLNAKSVQLQYNDPEPFVDTNSYYDELLRVTKKTARALRGADWAELQKGHDSLCMMARCINYQVEDEECNDAIMKPLNDIIARISEKFAERRDTESWGTFNY